MRASALELEALTERLFVAGCVAADEEAAELVAAAGDGEALEDGVRRRERGEPLAWITGSTRFCDRELRVERGVYVPRRQSEELARRAADLLASSGGRAADLCTGAGPIAAHLGRAVPGSAVIGVDLDPRAVSCARTNGVDAIVGELADALLSHSVDVVTAVPPYVPTTELRFLPADVRRYEPRRALDGGPDGLEVLRRIIASAARVLVSGGWLVLELGGTQDRSLSELCSSHGFTSISTWDDEDGDLRGLAARAS